jgi:pimeloyl-ACP methyl ester carboxylesterase
MFARIADLTVLRPSTHTIQSQSSLRHAFDFENGQLEYWVDHVRSSEQTARNENKFLLIKFPGTGGRAERASVHPAECWDYDTLTWTINPVGYGGSTGPASLQRFPAMIRAIGNHAKHQAGDRRIVVTGNSLGGMSALALAANFKVAGILLRNPVPLHQLIGQRPRYVWPTLGFSKWVASSIPTFLDSVANASKCDCPCWMVTCMHDQVVPINFQTQIWNALGSSTKQRFEIPLAGHDTPVPEELSRAYLDWIQDFGKSLASPWPNA